MADTETDQPEKGTVMSSRATLLLVASAIAGVASTAAVSTDAFAKKAVRHPAPVVVVAPAPVPVVLIDNNYGPVAFGIPRCFDSVIHYPTPPCY